MAITAYVTLILLFTFNPDNAKGSESETESVSGLKTYIIHVKQPQAVKEQKLIN